VGLGGSGARMHGGGWAPSGVGAGRRRARRCRGGGVRGRPPFDCRRPRTRAGRGAPKRTAATPHLLHARRRRAAPRPGGARGGGCGGAGQPARPPPHLTGPTGPASATPGAAASAMRGKAGAVNGALAGRGRRRQRRQRPRRQWRGRGGGDTAARSPLLPPAARGLGRGVTLARGPHPLRRRSPWRRRGAGSGARGGGEAVEKQNSSANVCLSSWGRRGWRGGAEFRECACGRRSRVRSRMWAGHRGECAV